MRTENRRPEAEGSEQNDDFEYFIGKNKNADRGH